MKIEQRWRTSSGYPRKYLSVTVDADDPELAMKLMRGIAGEIKEDYEEA